MLTPLINILIRVSRPKLFERCIASVREQTYDNINIIVGLDNLIGAFEISDQIFLYEKSYPYHWNLFCNYLKSRVSSGYLMIMDDDDHLSGPHAIQQLVNNLQDEPDGLIVQFMRNGKPKPNNHLIATKTIRKGLIGGGCLVLHSKHKNVADWQAIQAADYYWIRDVAAKVELKFVPLVLQVAGNNGLHGAAIDEITYERSSE